MVLFSLVWHRWKVTSFATKIALTCFVFLCFWDTVSAAGFIKADGTKLILNGKEYRAIGVNVPHLSQGYMGTWFHWKQIYGTKEKMRQSIIESIRDAEKHKVVFIRFSASPGYPKGTAELYLNNPDAYWRRMDELFELCRQHNLKLVPSLGVLLKWNLDFGEVRTAILVPKSKTYKMTYRYVRDFVTRYKDNPNVLMWELGNEYFLRAGVNMAGRSAKGKGIYPAGSTSFRKKFSFEDSFTFDMLVKFYKDMSAYIKSIDTHHLLTSGNAGVREESMSRRKTFPNLKFHPDTIREHLANLLLSQPEPLDVFSIHMYGNHTKRRKVDNLLDLDFLRSRVRVIHATRSPAFIGELGQVAPHFAQDAKAKWARAAIDMLDEEGVALIALWVWHFPWQAKDHNIPNGSSQPLLMQRVADFNAKYAW